MMLRSAIGALAFLFSVGGVAHAAINDALECSLPHDQAFAAVTALRLTQADSLSQSFAPGDARAFGLAPVRVSTVSDGEDDVVVVAVASAFDAVLPVVLSRRGLQACPDSYGSRDYCHFAGDSIGASLVVQADPDHVGFTVITCSYALHQDGGDGHLQ